MLLTPEQMLRLQPYIQELKKQQDIMLQKHEECKTDYSQDKFHDFNKAMDECIQYSIKLAEIKSKILQGIE